MKINIPIILTIALAAFTIQLNAQSDLLFSSANTAYIPAKTTTEAGKISISDFTQSPNGLNSFIKITSEESITIRIKIFTMNGDLVKEETRPLENGENNLAFNPDDLQEGTYIVQFYTSEGSAVRRYTKKI